ncbi:MAG: hypothetical protein ACOX3K_03000 [Bacilli bacterium]
MSDKKLSLLILACDKNYDLHPWINQTCEKFLELDIDCVIVTETLDEEFSEKIKVFKCGNKGFDQRFIVGVKTCETPYVLVLLDDYFVYDQDLKVKIDNWLNFMEKYDFHALRISLIKKLFIKKKKIVPKYYCFTAVQPYEIDFHPTIWNRTTLLALIDKRSFTPWTLEPLFALFLRDKKSGYTKKTIDFDELIIQGYFFKKPFEKFCKQEYQGEKKVFPHNKHLIYKIKTTTFNLLPYWMIKLLRKILKIKSISAEAQL